MKTKNKLISLFLALIMIFSFVSCEEYNLAVGLPSSDKKDDNEGGSEDDTPILNDDPTDDFTVSLVYNGAQYFPTTPMRAYWDNGYNLYAAPFDKDGVARIDGLDGDYRVRLSGLRNDFCYNPNAYIATNDSRNVFIELSKLIALGGGGTGMYDCYTFRETGVYTAVINSPKDGIWFEFAPPENGEYTIESWMDITADDVNPYIDVYNGSTAFKYYSSTTNDGGAVGSYTINFVHKVKIYQDNISAGGQVVYTFVVHAESKDDKYPISVTFAVTRDKPASREEDGIMSIRETKVPTYDFTNFNKADHEYGSNYKLVNPEYKLSGTANTYVFDEDNYRLWKKSDGGDDFYHVYDEVKYASTGGYGPIVYAYITSAFRYLDVSFNNVEYNKNGQSANAALTLYNVNYKHMIEGYTALTVCDLDSNSKFFGSSYYCEANCKCHNASVSLKDWVCPDTCKKCNSGCRKCPEALLNLMYDGKHFEGYQAYANSDGMVPVTEDIREFLNAYAGAHTFFLDGMGILDGGSSSIRIECEGDAAWLWACAYYDLK